MRGAGDCLLGTAVWTCSAGKGVLIRSALRFLVIVETLEQFLYLGRSADNRIL